MSLYSDVLTRDILKSLITLRQDHNESWHQAVLGFAASIGVAPRTVYRWLTGESRIPQTKCRLITELACEELAGKG